MKTLFSWRSSFFGVIALLLLTQFANAQVQNPQWALNNQLIDFSSGTPTLSGGCYAKGLNYLETPAGDQFYVDADRVGTCATPNSVSSPLGVEDSERVIIPVPDSCNKYFVVYPHYSSTSTQELYWVRYDADINAITQGPVLLATNSGARIALAAAPVGTNSSTFLYTLMGNGLTASNATIWGAAKWLVNGSGITFSQNLENALTNRSLYEPYEADLNHSGSLLAWGSPDIIPSSKAQIYQLGTTNQVRSTRVVGQTGYRCSGVEYSSSGRLYCNVYGINAQAGGGLYYLQGSSTVAVQGSGSYSRSNIELGYSTGTEYIYAVHIFGGSIGRANVSTNIFTANYMSVSAVKHRHANVYVLPDQLDGEDYSIGRGNVVANFTAPTALCAGNSVLVNGSSSVGDAEHEWLVQEVDCTLGTPIGGPSSSGWLTGPAGVFDMTIIFPSFQAGKCYELTLNVRNSCGLVHTKTTDLEIEAPNVDIFGPLTLCVGNTGTYNGFTSIQGPVQWILNGNLVFSGSQYFFTPTVAGTYTLKAVLTTTPNFCQATDLITIVVEDALSPAFSGNNGCVFAPICLTNATPGLNGTETYAWTLTGSTTPTSTLENPCVVYNAPGIYPVTLQVTNSCGTYTINGTVNVFSPPNPVINGISANCLGENVILSQGTPPQQGMICHWYVDGTLVQTGGTLTLTLTNPAGHAVDLVCTNSAGCFGTASVFISAHLPPVVSPDATICSGGCATFTVSNFDPNSNYNWVANSVVVGTGQTLTFCPTVSTVVYLANSTPQGCFFVTQHNVYVSAPMTVSLSENQTVKCGPKVLTAIVSGGVAPYTYSLNGGTPQSSNQFNVSPMSTTTYNVTVTDACGSITTPITVGKLPFYGPISGIIPNVFTPNGDGINDIWNPWDPTGANPRTYNACWYDLKVFNIWGNLLENKVISLPSSAVNGFSGNVIFWDGRTFGGSMVPDGTYFYILKVGNCSGSQTFNSYITVLGSSGNKMCPVNPAENPLEHVIATSTVWDTDRLISQDVVVENGAKLTIENSNVKFNSGVRVIVKAGGQLAVNGSVLEGCAFESAWRGIEVRGRKNKNHTPNWQGKIVVKNSTIRDATNGIYAGERDANFDNVGSGAGAIVLVKNNSVFENNGTHITIAKYLKPNNKNVIKNSTFGNLLADDLLNGNQPQILIKGAAGMLIENNMFTKFEMAIKARNTRSLKVVGNEFNGGKVGLKIVKSEGFSLTANTFNDTKRGIVLKTNTDDTPAYIEDNIVDGADISIELEDNILTELVIGCNDLTNFTEYAIDARSSTIADQGTEQKGCGNTFVSNSTQLNHCINTELTDFDYYAGPTNVNELSSPDAASVTVQSANVDASCSDKSLLAENATSQESTVSFVVYPNPSNGLFNVNFTGATGDVQLTVLNTLGAVVMSKTVSADSVSEIDLRNQADGVYIVQMITTNTNMTARITKQ
jgi:gliding motility-associated-like protein